MQCCILIIAALFFLELSDARNKLSPVIANAHIGDRVCSAIGPHNSEAVSIEEVKYADFAIGTAGNDSEVEKLQTHHLPGKKIRKITSYVGVDKFLTCGNIPLQCT